MKNRVQYKDYLPLFFYFVVDSLIKSLGMQRKTVVGRRMSV